MIYDNEEEEEEEVLPGKQTLHPADQEVTTFPVVPSLPFCLYYVYCLYWIHYYSTAFWYRKHGITEQIIQSQHHLTIKLFQC